jgi:uncharacterized protein YcbK (DUF882 family)
VDKTDYDWRKTLICNRQLLYSRNFNRTYALCHSCASGYDGKTVFCVSLIQVKAIVRGTDLMLNLKTVRSLDSDENLSNDRTKETTCLKRRGFLKLAALTAGGLAASPPTLASFFTPSDRVINLYSTNTGETLRLVYWTPRDGYVRESLAKINWLLRDYHSDEVKIIDPILLDQLYSLQSKLGYRSPFHVISGYRSPATNAKLHRTSRRVARHSYHIQGKAVDIRTPGLRLADVRATAMSLQAGGVGYYPYANFIHIDTGPIRYWS